MTALIVGADALGNLPERLKEKGFGTVLHWDGRSPGYRTKPLPKRVGTVFVLCDFVSHSLMQNIKRRSRTAGIPVVYAKRSLADLDGRHR